MVEDEELTSFGAPILKRKYEIAEKIKQSTNTYSIEFQGKYQYIPVIIVKIGFLVYRLENGRTRTLQRQYLAEHPNAPKNLFEKDHDAIEAQMAQHEILGKIIDEEGLKDYFKNNHVEQLEPIICTKDGVVVNGNRRLCTWRTLFESNPERYKHFQNISIAILPDCDDEDIRSLEKKLQIQNSMKAKYSWHTLALMCSEELQRNTSPKPTPTSVGASIGRSAQDVNILIEARNYAEDYLKAIGKEDIWSEVDKAEYAFTQFVKSRKKLKSFEDKVLFEKICFLLIEKSGVNGRLYSQIPDVADNLHEVAVQLGLELGIKQEEPKTEDEELLSGGSEEKPETAGLAAVIDNEKDKEKVVTIVQKEVEKQKELKSEKSSKDFLLNSVSKASNYLNTAAYNGLRPECSKEGVTEQLRLIEENVERIKKWLAE